MDSSLSSNRRVDRQSVSGNVVRQSENSGSRVLQFAVVNDLRFATESVTQECPREAGFGFRKPKTGREHIAVDPAEQTETSLCRIDPGVWESGADVTSSRRVLTTDSQPVASSGQNRTALISRNFTTFSRTHRLW